MKTEAEKGYDRREQRKEKKDLSNTQDYLRFPGNGARREWNGGRAESAYVLIELSFNYM